MPNKNSSLEKFSTNKVVKIYDANDVSEGYVLAYEQVSDLAVMLDAISSKYNTTAEYIQKVYNVPESVFKDFKRLIGITNTLLDESIEFSKTQKEQYQAEYEESQA